MSWDSRSFTLGVAFYSFDILIIRVCSYMKKNELHFHFIHSDIISDFSMGVSVGGHTMEGALCWFPSDDSAGARGIALEKKNISTL